MILEVAGDLLLSKAHAIAHGVAPNDPFHQGLALQIRERMPALYKDFRHYCQTQHPAPGNLWTWMGADGRVVINLFTQEAAYEHGAKPGRASTHNVGLALRELRKLIDAEKFKSLAMPRLATGVGGLEWQEVLPLIRQHLGDLQIPVVIYATYHAGQVAAEGL
jgi:O-acetyl-ADP-ribose deacetylase (regulator of RNase III)